MKKLTFILFLTISFCGCNYKSSNTVNQNVSLQAKNDSLINVLKEKKFNMNKNMATFLTFQENNAEEAMNFYIKLFKESKIIEVQRYDKHELAKDGTIMKATFELNGMRFICSDSYIKHEWSFTPAVSIFVELDSESELNKLFAALSEDGKIMMPLDNYGFSKKFGFVEDKFGISWQLNLE